MFLLGRLGPSKHEVSDLEDSPSDFSFMVPTESLLVMSGMDDSRLTSLLGQVDHILLSNDQLVLKLAHLLAIRRHERALAGGLLHDLVSDQL